MDLGAAAAAGAAPVVGAAGVAVAGVATTGATTSLVTGAGAGFAGCAAAKDGMVTTASSTKNFFNIFINLAPYYGAAQERCAILTWPETPRLARPIVALI